MNGVAKSMLLRLLSSLILSSLIFLVRFMLKNLKLEQRLSICINVGIELQLIRGDIALTFYLSVGYIQWLGQGVPLQGVESGSVL